MREKAKVMLGTKELDVNGVCKTEPMCGMQIFAEETAFGGHVDGRSSPAALLVWR